MNSSFKRVCFVALIIVIAVVAVNQSFGLTSEPALCTNEQLTDHLASFDVDILAADDVALLLALFIVESSEQPTHEQILQQYIPSYEVFETYISSGHACYELTLLIAARTSLINQAAHLIVNDGVIADNEKAWLEPITVVYLANLVSVVDLLESSKDTINGGQRSSVVETRVVPGDGVIWSQDGRGEQEISVDLSFQPGIYRFNIIKPTSDGWGGVQLDDVVETPEDCFFDGYYPLLHFPTQKRLHSNCQVFATLSVRVFTYPGEDERTQWEVSITKLD